MRASSFIIAAARLQLRSAHSTIIASTRSTIIVPSSSQCSIIQSSLCHNRSYSTYRSSSVSSFVSRLSSSPSSSSSSISASPSSLPLHSTLSFTPGTYLSSVRHATKKAGGSSKNSQDSIGKRLGLKKSGGQVVKAGHILVRQRGSKVHIGRNVASGRDDTLYALVGGRVAFSYLRLTFHNRKRLRKYIHVLEGDDTVEALKDETLVKSAALAELYRLHKRGVWLPSPARQLKLDRAREKNKEVQRGQSEELKKAIEAGEDQTVMQHPMIAIFAEQEAATKAAEAAKSEQAVA